MTSGRSLAYFLTTTSGSAAGADGGGPDVVKEVDLHSGETTWEFEWKFACLLYQAIPQDERLAFCSQPVHLNHVHVSHEATPPPSLSAYLYLSARDLNAVVKVSRASGLIVWILGGDYSDFEDETDYDSFDDDEYDSATDSGADGADSSSSGGSASYTQSLFYGQYNVERLGESDALILFDNGVDRTSATCVRRSRYAVVAYSEESRKARVTWTFSTGMRSLEFGDADALPSGNILGSAWPFEVVAADDHPPPADAVEARAELAAETAEATQLQAALRRRALARSRGSGDRRRLGYSADEVGLT